MDVYHIGEFTKRGVLAHEDADLLDNIGTMSAIGMTAEDFARRGNKEFQQAFGFAHSEGLAIGAPKGFLALVVDALFLQLILCWSHASSLWLGKDGCWHDIEADAIRLAQNLIDSMNGLHLSSMGEHLTAISVANGVEVRGER